MTSSTPVILNVQVDSGPVTWPAIVVHGGAGTYERLFAGNEELGAVLHSAIKTALDAGWAALSGGDPLEAVIAAIEFLENHGGFNAGRGSVPNTAGGVEMDAGVMDDAGNAGAVACMTVHSAIRSAEAVMRADGPLLLAGPNADRFAARGGVPRLSAGDPTGLSDEGTVGAVAVGKDGRFAAASSTGGRPGQMPGRVGDTPIPGAGFWAQPGCAVSATGAGEAFVLAGFSRLVGSRVAAGEDLPPALRAGLEAVASHGGSGGGIALGPDRTWATAFSTAAMARGVRHAGGSHVVILG